MTSQYVRALGVVVGVAAVLGMASISADQPSDEQVSRQIERQLSKNEAFRDVTISVQEHVASLHGAVSTLQAREQAIHEARAVQGVQEVVSHLLIPSAENDSVLAPAVISQTETRWLSSLRCGSPGRFLLEERPGSVA